MDGWISTYRPFRVPNSEPLHQWTSEALEKCNSACSGIHPRLWERKQDLCRYKNRSLSMQHLFTLASSGLDTVWTDRGSGADVDVHIMRARLPADYKCFIGGDYALAGRRAHRRQVRAYEVYCSVGVTKQPSEYKWAWDDRKSGAKGDVTLVKAVCPRGYHAMGDLALGKRSHWWMMKGRVPSYSATEWQKGHTRHECVKNSHCRYTTSGRGRVWSDRGSGAKYDVSMYRIGGSRMFDANPVRGHNYCVPKPNQWDHVPIKTEWKKECSLVNGKSGGPAPRNCTPKRVRIGATCKHVAKWFRHTATPTRTVKDCDTHPERKRLQKQGKCDYFRHSPYSYDWGCMCCTAGWKPDSNKNWHVYKGCPAP